MSNLILTDHKKDTYLRDFMSKISDFFLSDMSDYLSNIKFRYLK